MSRDPVRAIADAVLYEGYILWPYRRSALKNQRRFTFGGVYPPAHHRVHPDDAARMRTEVLLRGRGQSTVTVTVRFLQVMERTVARRRGDELETVAELIAGDERHLPWDEAVERELTAGPLELEHLRAGAEVPIAIDAGRTVEEVGPGAIVRTWQALRGTVRLRADPLDAATWRLAVTIANETPCAASERAAVLRQTLCSTHTLLHVGDGAFVSLADPPADLVEAAAACANVGTWPVLVGPPEDRSTVLSSPIILEDHPRIAPESPGDLFDGGEIDGLLVLNIVALTDAEKAEMVASDPRAREILERTEALTPEQLMALHGTVREVGPVR